MAKLILVRHGQTDWNKQNRVQGSLDIPLNDEGKKEAQNIAGELKGTKIDFLLSSPAACSMATADEIATSHSLKVKAMPELNELNHGVWQGLLLGDVKKRYKKQYNNWRLSPTSARPPRGESTSTAYDRAISAVHKIIDKNKGKNICLVSHDIILSMIKCYHEHTDLKEIWKFIPEKAWWETLEL